ncbi:MULTISPECIES: NAD-dependent epimerase/dehydratase family protein [Thermomonosporaceae]|uniref:NAD-dependent epimerase/dehydratase family protein n=1 Tax=Thermomonosporaceae TaxID=2012 RepID=UPI00255A8407|nr:MULTISPECIES: NAD-dependent epimerase/dehydratase family protein [Thermomonosporaceae]MDL4772637.1 NAD-dependent epimerase/dehydratase family protein [Actinomadura xylanilytica]
MRVVVTGAAGFIGGQVTDALSHAGHEVLAVDAPGRALCPDAARPGWARLAGRPGVTRIEADLALDDLAGLVEADAIVHLAGRPGVRSSWGAGRALAERDNVTATRRLLEACAGRPARLRPRVVVASSSSVYGSAGLRPNREDDALDPASPYAVSKVEVERLTRQAARDGLRTVLLRYFSVYGPRQRPDMAFHRFVEAVLDGRPLPVFGDGRRSRSFTHVGDVAAATLAAVAAELPPGIAINVGHPEPVRVRAAIELLTGVLGVPAEIRSETPVAGDATRTWADPGRAARLLGWTAQTALAGGLADQISWHRGLRVHEEVRAG